MVVIELCRISKSRGGKEGRREGGGSGEEMEVLAVQEEIQELDTGHSDSAIMLPLA